MYRTFFCVVFLVSLAAGSAEGAVTISTSQHEARVYNASPFTMDYDTTSSTSIPASIDLSATMAGGTAASHLTRSAAGNTVFDVTFSGLRTGSKYSYAQSSGNDRLTVDVPTSFAVSGTSTMSGAGGLVLEYLIKHVATDTIIFYSAQRSGYTPNESFTLGLTEGDFYNNLIGSPTGLLQPGVDYQFYYTAYVYSYPVEQPPASHSGEITVIFADAPNVVPEPATLAIWSLFGAVGMGIGWRRRRRAA
jgi:hypothetical protein